mgnify:CR=1 FL=1
MTILQVKNLRKAYHDGTSELSPIADVSLTVQAGERIAIMGSSGSGKSTLLHLLGGLDTPTAGSVTLMGRNLAGLDETTKGLLRNHSLGFVYQFHHLLPEFSAQENVAMPLWIRGINREQALQTAAQWLDKVGLSNRLTHRPGELSGGERQRTAIARALVTQPKCLLADEPTGNLDKQNAEGVFDLMVAMSCDINTALVVVTHDMALARRLDTRYRLTEGTLTACE